MSRKCPYLEKRADNPQFPNIEKSYEKGDRWRPYCVSQLTWCTFPFDYEECCISQRAGE